MKIALIYTDDFSLWIFRKELIEKLIQNNCQVITVSAPGSYVRLLKKLGAVHIPVDFSRFINPIQDIKVIMKLFLICRREKFDIVHSFTIKPNIYGALTAWFAGTRKIILSITGWGFPFADNASISIKLWIIRFLVDKLYRMAFKVSTKIWFQNDEERWRCVENRMVKKKQTVLINSSGVNLEEYSPKSVDNKILRKIMQDIGHMVIDRKVVMMIGRALWTKGVAEFIESAKLLDDKLPDAIFLLVGGREEGNPEGIHEAYIKDREEEVTNFYWLGHRTEIRELIYISELIVLPSYHEGAPRSLIEAMAMGKPIVTTDICGCRKMVDEGQNGYCVPIKNAKALADAILRIMSDSIKLETFGHHSRKKAEKEFDQKSVVNRTISELYQMPQICRF